MNTHHIIMLVCALTTLSITYAGDNVTVKREDRQARTSASTVLYTFSTPPATTPVNPTREKRHSIGRTTSVPTTPLSSKQLPQHLIPPLLTAGTETSILFQNLHRLTAMTTTLHTSHAPSITFSPSSSLPATPKPTSVDTPTSRLSFLSQEMKDKLTTITDDTASLSIVTSNDLQQLMINQKNLTRMMEKFLNDTTSK